MGKIIFQEMIHNMPESNQENEEESSSKENIIEYSPYEVSWEVARKNISKISEAAMSRMNKHTWPGNIRELQHSLERAIILSNSTVLQPEDFNFNTATPKESDQHINLDQYNLDEVEKLLIRKVLKKYNGNITQAATELGLTRSSLYRRLEKHGL